MAARVLIATYCEPQHWKLNWQLHALFASVQELAAPHVDFLATIPPGTRELVDPRIPVRVVEPIHDRFQHPAFEATIGVRYYPHINTFLAVAGLATDHAYVVHTDCDTIVTPRFAELAPRAFTVGEHRYSTPGLRARLHRFCTRHGYRERPEVDFGPTWFGPADEVIHAGESAITIGEQLLAEEDWHDPEGGPVFNLALFAAEIAIHQHAREIAVVPGMLDGHSTGDGTPEQVHVHMWQLAPRDWQRGFAKSAFARGYYDQPGLPPRTGNAALLERFARLGWARSAELRVYRCSAAEIDITSDRLVVRDGDDETELELDAELVAVARELVARGTFREAEAYAVAPGYPVGVVHDMLEALAAANALTLVT